MRVAALYDIHGNLPALEAVLAELERDQPDVILVGGDFVPGPFPGETLERLRSLAEARFIRGNGEREVARGGWVAEQLTSEQREFLAGLPELDRLDVDALGPTLFCHGSPRSDEEIITAITPEERLRPMLTGVPERVVVCGHTHVQFDRMVGSNRVVNAGSVGMPYQGRPGAYWALLGPDVELRRSEYDVAETAERVRATGYPGADELARENILASPSAQEATEYFESLATEAS